MISDYEQLTCKALKEKCDQRGIGTRGTRLKKDLINRLLEDDRLINNDSIIAPALAFSGHIPDPPSSPTGAGAPPNVAPPVQTPTAGAPAPDAGANEDELKRLQLEFTRLKVEGQKLKVEGQKNKHDHNQRMNVLEVRQEKLNQLKVTQAELGTQLNDLEKYVNLMSAM